jgi:hypothetical protein
MKKWIVGLIAVLLCALSVSAVDVGSYDGFVSTNFTLSGTAATGTVVNADYAVQEIYFVGSSITDTNTVTATNTVTMKILPAGASTSIPVRGYSAQVEGAEAGGAPSTNGTVTLLKGDTLYVIQSLASGTNALTGISSDYLLQSGVRK